MKKDLKIRKTISIDDTTQYKLAELGNGNLSKGVRILLGEADVELPKEQLHSASPTMVYMQKEHKKLLKDLGLGNVSKGLRLMVTQYRQMAQDNADRMKDVQRTSTLTTPQPTTITQPPAHDDRPRRKPKPLIQPTATQSTSPTLPLPPKPPVSQPKRPPLTVLTPEQTARVHEYLGIPANANPQPQIMCTVANSLWVQEYHNPTTGKLILEQEVSLNQFDPPL